MGSSMIVLTGRAGVGLTKCESVDVQRNAAVKLALAAVTQMIDYT
jgi:hypothetical protein